MSIYFSQFMLNTYSSTSYFEAHAPEGYPLSLVLQKCRAFRRLPPNLRELSARSKKWATSTPGFTDRLPSVEGWYDDDGYELNPDTGARLTDEEIDRQWNHDPGLAGFTVQDIPIPDGGFADPGTWKEPAPERSPDADIPTLEKIISDIGSHGREYTADYYGIPADQVRQAKSDEELARLILRKLRPEMTTPTNRGGIINRLKHFVGNSKG